jgi:hypothetical protein
MELPNSQHKEALVKKTITEIIGGAQGLLNISPGIGVYFH